MANEQPMRDVIDQAAGLVAGAPLHSARHARTAVVQGSQASHDALLFEPVAGLSTADRLRVAAQVCRALGALQLQVHYQGLLQSEPAEAAQRGVGAAAAAATAVHTQMLSWAHLVTTDPKSGDRAALLTLRQAGLPDAATVALAQLVAFLAYQVRVVAGLRALNLALQSSTVPVLPTRAQPPAQAEPSVAEAARQAQTGAGVSAPAGVIRSHGFTNESLQWRSWLEPVDVAQASPLQLAVLDESHAQARTSAYYLTLVHQPLMLRHRSAAYNAIMYAPGGAPRAERELAALAVSVANGCVYCTSVHAQRYAQLAKRQDTVQQVFASEPQAGSTPREQAVVAFGRAVTQRPAALGVADIQLLQAQGLDAGQILDVLHAAAIFGWANRLMHNLGEPVV